MEIVRRMLTNNLTPMASIGRLVHARDARNTGTQTKCGPSVIGNLCFGTVSCRQVACPQDAAAMTGV